VPNNFIDKIIQAVMTINFILYKTNRITVANPSINNKMADQVFVITSNKGLMFISSPMTKTQDKINNKYIA